MSSAVLSNPRFGWKPWLAATVLAVLLHLPLLWVQLQRVADDDTVTDMVELLLTPPEPIPVSPPSDWADEIELKWTLGGEPDPTRAPPEFAPLAGLDDAALALDSSFGGLTTPQTADDAEREPASAPPPEPASPAAEDTQTAAAPQPDPDPADTPPQPTQSDRVAASLEAAIDTALAGTERLRPPPTQSQPPPQVQSAEAPSTDPIARALAQTPAVRTPAPLPDDLQALLDEVPATAPPAVETEQPARPTQPQQPARAAPQTAEAAPEQQYQAEGPAGSYSSDRDAFFSNLAEHLFTVNDQRLRARPYTRRQIIDVRFSIDRQGRVMRVWTPAPRQSAATDAAKAMIWAASPVPQLSPDMPQAVLELTFPVIVGQ